MKHHDTEYDAAFRMATDSDNHLETYDHTKLSAVNTCPTWGILRYQMHRAMPSTGRSMALEAGTAMHEVFALVRLYSLILQCREVHGLSPNTIDQLWHYHGTRLFGLERLEHIVKQTNHATDVVEQCKMGAIAVLDTGGFHDDPRDRRRTLANLEEAAFAYINRWRFDHNVWIRSLDEPTTDVGIEIPFDVHVSISGMDLLQFRLTGRIDGIHYDGLNRLTVHDNKTASRLGEAWSMAQVLNHQYTGYCAAASVFTQDVVSRYDVLGLAIPLPKTYDFGGFSREPGERHHHHYADYVRWLAHTVALTRRYANDPEHAPRYTHSCNRYFRPCSFIPYCYGDPEERKAIIEEMVVDEWSPLNKLVLDGVGNE
jgi:hypothetical protein